jgi:hypothetical protein
MTLISVSHLKMAADSVTTGSDTFAVNPHANESFSATGENNETFEYASGFGQSAITGFLATGTAHDVIQLGVSMFSYLTPTMTLSEDVTALLAQATQVGANVVIADSASDALTLNNVTKATLAANPSDFQFV